MTSFLLVPASVVDSEKVAAPGRGPWVAGRAVGGIGGCDEFPATDQ